jgi:aryl-alcohol dehydrogenase-like predicted oxidoreductase
VADHPSLGGVPMVLGGNVYGWTIQRDRSFEVLDAFYEAGGRMIDTAEGYSAWVPGNKGGESETIIGEWLESRDVRKEMRIGTKTGMAQTRDCLQEPAVRTALQGSLERLRTDYLDLYYVHMDNGQTPLEDIARAFDATMKCGMVREIGLSNTLGERLTGLFETTDRSVHRHPAQAQFRLPHRICRTDARAVQGARDRRVPLLQPRLRLSHRQVPLEGRLGEHRAQLHHR